MAAFYNEPDPYAAQWLRNLIAGGHIAPGIVDESDIRDIVPTDLLGYTQCHFFAGIGVWSHALRRAGWADDRPIWTGSCPCQPFSAAGARAGFADERHLWPAFNHLIEQCRPPVVAGEQVENAGDWLDLVSADLEAQGYAFGAAFLPAAGFGGAHIRSRNYWVAYAQHAERWPVHVNRQDGRDRENDRRPQAHSVAGTCGEVHGLADSTNRGRGIVGRALEPGDVRHVDGGGDALGGLADSHIDGCDQAGSSIASARHDGFERNSAPRGMGDGEQPRLEGHAGHGDPSEEPGRDSADAAGPVTEAGGVSRMADADGRHAKHSGTQSSGQQRLFAQGGSGVRPGGSGARLGSVDATRTGAPMLGRNAVDWLFCRDGRWRPTKPGLFPLVDAYPNRVGVLRAAGNALDAETATGFVKAMMECI